MAARNDAWSLQTFLGALVVELDRAQDTLALKAASGRRLSYTVKDIGLDLQIFPVYADESVRFVTAQPGQEGSSRINLQLGSITDRMIRETTREPATEEDILIRELPALDDITKKQLEKVGVDSARDLERLQERNVSLKSVLREGDAYGNLADMIRASRREKQAPQVTDVSLTQTAGGERLLVVRGENLKALSEETGYPMATCNNQPIAVVRASSHEVWMRWPSPAIAMALAADSGPLEFALALDPYAVVRFRLAG